MPSAYNYVKFQRGTQAAYDRLRNKDENTLYFIYADAENQYGSLYLGDKLISGGDVQVVSASLSDLSDVAFNGAVQDGMLLQYRIVNGEGKWRPTPLSEIISDLPSGNTNTSIIDDLDDIENPAEGDIAVVDGNMYIYDGEEWVPVTSEVLEDKVADLESLIGHPADAQEDIPATGLYADIAALDAALENVYTKTEINALLADGATHLTYQIITSINDIDLTSEEIDYTIYLVPKGTVEQNNGYDEYFVINGSLEKIGTTNINLNDYVQTTDNRLLTQEQKDKLDAITLDSNDNLVITAAQVSDLATEIEGNQFIKSVENTTFSVDANGQLSLIGIPASVIDLSDYALKSEVGDLSSLLSRVSANSTLVDEINAIKANLAWNDIPNE